MIGDLLVGLVGAFIGDWLLPQLGIHLGVGIVALVGTGVYWVLAKKQGTTTTEPAAAIGPKVVPFVGPSFGGLSVSAAF